MAFEVIAAGLCYMLHPFAGLYLLYRKGDAMACGVFLGVGLMCCLGVCVWAFDLGSNLFWFLVKQALGAVMSPSTPTLVPMATPPAAAPTMMPAVPAITAPARCAGSEP